MKVRILILSMFLCSVVFGQNFWTPTQLNQKELKQSKAVISGERLYAIDLDALSNHLRNAPERNNFRIQSNVTLEIPNIYGKSETFYIAEASNFTPELQAKYPEIRSYRGINLADPSVSMALSISPKGVQVMRLEVGQPTTFIEAVTADNTVYQIFEKRAKRSDWTCHTPDDVLEDDLTQLTDELARDADDQILRDFRLALSCTGEYAIYHGGTVAGALAGMNATMTRVNPVFERDMALHLTMIDNNEDVVFTDPSTDPYSPSSGMNNWNGQLQSTLTSIIGEANYDIGHLFGASGGGGNAGCIGCVCETGKGSGITSPADNRPEGDTFDIDYVAHELGHQLGANHTFSSYEGSGVNYEPGSGSTIMGYAGIVSGYNVQQHSDDYFHAGSIRQVTQNIKSKTCPTEIPIVNNTPTADAGPNYIIPAGTAFVLTGSGSDPDDDNLTYCWEQVDSSRAGTSFQHADPNSTSGPLVRSYLPTTIPTRYIPSFEKVLNGNLYSEYESVSQVARNMNFNLQVRDNNPEIGQTKSDATRISVTAVGGVFRVTGPTSSTTVVPGEENEITWDVAQTNQDPVNTAYVDIYLSTDGGESFNLLADNVANTGSANIMFPEDSETYEARIMIKAVDNIYYAVGSEFYIGYEVSSECFSYEAQGLPRDIMDGSSGSFGSYAIGQFQVANHGAIDEITIEVDITHPYIGDLQVALQSPSPNQLINLWDQDCSFQDDLNVIFDDNGSAVDCSNLNGNTVIPSTLLGTFSGYQSQGNWNIGVRDGGTGDVGTFNSATATFCNFIANPIGTNDIASGKKSQINVYPNPSNGVFNFEVDLEDNGIAYKVFDVTGKLLSAQKDSNAVGRYSNQIDLSSFAKGTYILQVVTGNKIISKKLLVK